MEAHFVVRRGDDVMPFFQEVAGFLWGEVDYDSEGNCRWPTDREWTELEISRRGQDEDRWLIIESDENRTRDSVVSADDPVEAKLAAVFLARRTGGEILDVDGKSLDVEELASTIEDLDARFANADAVRDRFLSPDFEPWWH